MALKMHAEFRFPDEVVAKILLLVDYKSVMQMSCVSKQWLDVLASEEFWSQKFWRDFGGEPEEQRTKEEYLHEWKLRHCDPQLDIVWGDACYWKFCSSIAIGRDLEGGMRVVDMDSRTCIGRIDGELVNIYSIASNGKCVIAGFFDGSIGWWDLETGACIRTRSGHSDVVQCLDCDDKMVVSGSLDRLIRVWDMQYGGCVLTLQGHVRSVECVQINPKNIVSGSWDMTVKVWDRDNGHCLVTLHHDAKVNFVKCGVKWIVSGCDDGTTWVWDRDTSICMRKLQCHPNAVTCLYVDGSKIVSGGDDRSIKVWDLRTGQWIRTCEINSSIAELAHCHGQSIYFAVPGCLASWKF